MKLLHASRRDALPCGGASLEEKGRPDNEVRPIDAFVDSLPLEKLGSRTDFTENGRPAYHLAVLLKLLVYGYLYRSHPTSFLQYRTKACKTCPARARCTTAKNGKLIERNVYSPIFERNRQNIQHNTELYKRPKTIVEHPFGTLKRQGATAMCLQKKYG